MPFRYYGRLSARNQAIYRKSSAVERPLASGRREPHAARRAHSRMACLSAAWRVSPLAWARSSSSAQISSGNRTDRGVVAPDSRSRFGRPRPTWTTSPSVAIRRAYGFRLTRALRKSTSGMSRNDRVDGSRRALLFPFFITSPLVVRGAPRADQPHDITTPLDEHHEQDASCERFANDASVLGVTVVLDDRSQWIGEDGRGFLEGDSVLSCVSVGLVPVPLAPHELSVLHFTRNCRRRFRRPRRRPHGVKLVRLPQPARFLVLTALAMVSGGCARGLQGVPVEDRELRELLRPNEPVEHERLLQAGGEVFYEAELRQRPSGHYRHRYLAELEERGFSIWPSGTSPHDGMQRIIGYDVRVVQEAVLEPYTIRYRTTWEGNGPERDLAQLLLHGWNFPHPVSVSGRRVVVRLSSDFLKPWAFRVVAPEKSLANPPDDFPVPLPPTGVLVDVDDGRNAGRQTIQLDMIARIPASEVISFFQEKLEGISRNTSESADIGKFPIGDVRPPWVPRRTVLLFVSAKTFLFSGPSIMVNDARYPNVRPRGVPDNGQYQSPALRHVPADARQYWISVDLK
jgi:hypothetical protein